MNKYAALSLLLINGCLWAPVIWSSPLVKVLSEAVVMSVQESRAAPVLSAKYAFSIDQAYQVQSLAVKQRLGSKRPNGFKAGLTSLASQKKFGVDVAVAGVLLADGHHVKEGGRFVIDRSGFNNIMLEAEIGFRLKTSVKEKVADVATLKMMVAEVLPVVEFPDLSFDRPTLLKGEDIIANNVVAKQHIAGESQSLGSLEINALSVFIYKDGEMILKGSSSDAMGDQWQALLWLINKTVENGWQIDQGQILITGALGKMIPAKPGYYQIDYGALGQIDFLLE
jgi:2-keto-4-pentenoate hydratase